MAESKSYQQRSSLVLIIEPDRSVEPTRNMEVRKTDYDTDTPAYATHSQIKAMRRQSGNRLSTFAPVNDLSLISRSSDLADGHHARSQPFDGRNRDTESRSGTVLGDEWAEHVVKNRNGIMLRAS